VSPTLHISNLGVGYKSNELFSNLNLHHQNAGLIALMGRNGIGKTTLLRCLAGLKAAHTGDIIINQKALHQLTAAQRARMVSLVLTHRSDSGWMSVEELVRLGRNPYTNWWGKFSSEDHARVDEVISLTGLQDLKKRPLFELSDGQLQKALLARALAQDGDLIFLDEPLMHLDPPNKWEIMQLLHQTAHQQNKILIMATHEIELSVNHADYIWLAHSGGIQYGLPEDLMLSRAFNKVFDHNNYQFESWSPGNSNHALVIKGAPDLVAWTTRALSRRGIDKRTHGHINIEIEAQEENNLWTMHTADKSIPCTSIEALIKQIKDA